MQITGACCNPVDGTCDEDVTLDDCETEWNSNLTCAAAGCAAGSLCGDGCCQDTFGENCFNCPSDCGCGPNDICVSGAGECVACEGAIGEGLISVRYCVVGTAEGGTFSWRISSPSLFDLEDQSFQSPQMGASSAEIVRDMVESINTKSASDPASIDENNPTCFYLEMCGPSALARSAAQGGSAFKLFVGTGGLVADCEVDAVGCEVNPLIYNANARATIPTISQWGVVVMALLLVTGGTIVLIRRRLTATVPAG